MSEFYALMKLCFMGMERLYRPYFLICFLFSLKCAPYNFNGTWLSCSYRAVGLTHNVRILRVNVTLLCGHGASFVAHISWYAFLICVLLTSSLAKPGPTWACTQVYQCPYLALVISYSSDFGKQTGMSGATNFSSQVEESDKLCLHCPVMYSMHHFCIIKILTTTLLLIW